MTGTCLAVSAVVTDSDLGLGGFSVARAWGCLLQGLESVLEMDSRTRKAKPPCYLNGMKKWKLPAYSFN